VQRSSVQRSSVQRSSVQRSSVQRSSVQRSSVPLGVFFEYNSCSVPKKYAKGNNVHIVGTGKLMFQFRFRTANLVFQLGTTSEMF
jgi:hypothetical protein